MLNITDLASIESRVLGWISNCKGINHAFENNLDTYKLFATSLYNIEYAQVSKKQRNFCKPPVLGAGYRLGAGGLVNYAKGMGVILTFEEAGAMITLFRTMYWEVPEFWKWCKEAVFHTTLTGGRVDGAHGLYTYAHGEFLFIHLPSGRSIAYHKPEIRDLPAPWNVEQLIPQFTFMGRHKKNHKWCRISAHDGHICENIVQAIARDIIALWMLRARAAGHPLILHVHDEICTEDDRDRVEELNELIRIPIPWAPGLILDAKGFTAKRYRKG